MLHGRIVKALGQYRQYRSRVLRAKAGNATKIEHKMELLKEQIDELINIDPTNAMMALEFIEYFADADAYTFNELELFERPYKPIARVERIEPNVTASSKSEPVVDNDPVAEAKLKQMLQELKRR